MRRPVKNIRTLLFTLLAVGFSLMSLASFAQSKDEKEVARAVEGLRTAMVKADTVQLRNIAMDELSYGHSSGKLQNKNEFISSFATGASVFVTLEFTEQTIKVVGNTAIVRHILSAKTNDSGRPGAVHLGILLVWQKSHGSWHLLARQAVKV
ncbi:DUF4440 domain-containing protein [Mucilaginibacter sp. PPCGB 2223]|uniref:nuclear transport factor 2 family protein n=1 Tax=Mucilaginibacter sp. PPCGB 2223 TaxID=1886027 RepID=UPI0008267A45|nr:nuclear transport factor 2 family protein [Mucilaginibacter sp. PPCGB 2223]OCX51622.1 DUF4440 domain-containing protein [Mucilaginibacter sp. PPCGB 2223]